MLTKPALDAIVGKVLASALGSAFARSDIRFGEDHEGDEALFVRAYLKPRADRPSSKVSLDAMVALRSRLLEEGEARRPYLDLDYPVDDEVPPRGRAA